MVKIKKIELLLAILILLVVCIFSLGDSIEIPEDSGFGLHEFGSLIGKRKIKIYYDDDYPVECIIRNENGEFEWVTKYASDYKDFVEGIEGNEDRPGGIELWNIAAGYELLDWEVVEDPMLATVIIKIDHSRRINRIGYCKAPEYDKDGNLVRSGYIKINVYNWEKRNPDGTSVLSTRDLEENIAHEFGHLAGLVDLGSKALWDTEPLEMIDLMYNIMFFQRNYVKSVTAEDVAGMEACTENYTCGEWVPIGEADRCRQCECTTNLGGCSFTYFDTSHSWTDESDTTCNDCDYMRPIAIEEVDGLLTVTLDGLSWVLNYSVPWTEHEWSQFPPKFSELLGYSSSNNLPKGGATLSWGDHFIISDGTVFHRYCYKYNGIDYVLGQYQSTNPESFYSLREMTKIKDNKGRYHYLSYINKNIWAYQWYQTTKIYQGIFWARLCGDEVNGYYVIIYRGLVDAETGDIGRLGNEVWTPSIHFPVYFSP